MFFGLQSWIWPKPWSVGSRVHAERKMVPKKGSGGKFLRFMYVEDNFLFEFTFLFFEPSFFSANMADELAKCPLGVISFFCY